MFLHALLFFLLGTCVFAAPAGNARKTALAAATGGLSDYHKVEKPGAPYHFGLWYPLVPPPGHVRIANLQPSF